MLYLIRNVITGLTRLASQLVFEGYYLLHSSLGVPQLLVHLPDNPFSFHISIRPLSGLVYFFSPPTNWAIVRTVSTLNGCTIIKTHNLSANLYRIVFLSFSSGDKLKWQKNVFYEPDENLVIKFSHFLSALGSSSSSPVVSLSSIGRIFNS